MRRAASTTAPSRRPTATARRVALAIATLVVATLLQPVAAEGQAGRAFASDDFNRAELGDERARYEPRISADERETLLDGWHRALERSRGWAREG